MNELIILVISGVIVTILTIIINRIYHKRDDEKLRTSTDIDRLIDLCKECIPFIKSERLNNYQNIKKNLNAIIG